MRRQRVTAQVEQKVRILDYASDAKQLLKTPYIYCLLQLGSPGWNSHFGHSFANAMMEAVGPNEPLESSPIHLPWGFKEDH
jgi:hypothetical protein